MNMTTNAPTTQTYTLAVPDGQETVIGRQLGFATSRTETHRNHDGLDYMRPGGGRCSACRWFEIRIIQVDDPDQWGGQYVVHTWGRTIVPDEISLCRIHVTSSPYEIIRILTVHKNGHTYIPMASARALAQAAHWDDDIRQAYVDMEKQSTRR